MKRLACLALVLATATPALAGPGPLRLRGDALATTASPAGLLVLEAENAYQAEPGALSAEAVVWFANDAVPGQDRIGDVLVIAVNAHDRRNRARARLGRFVSTLGALRATHIDGGQLRVNLPARFQAEAVAGVPVTAGLGCGETITAERSLSDPCPGISHSWDWLAGGRVSRKLGFGGSLGVAYEQRRDHGQLATEEVGFDAGMQLGKRGDLGARVAYDLVNPGLAEVMVTATVRDGATRTEIYGIHREASHLLPANSLFTVLGDTPSQRGGYLLTWKAAPRLDVIMDLGLRHLGNDNGLEAAFRTRLRLDDKGRSMVGAELRRSGVGDDAWLGARGTARLRMPYDVVLSSELELVRPDTDRGRGTLWPWAVVAAGWEHGEWQAAIATEATSSPEYKYRVDVLAQLARRWGTK